MMVWWDGGDGLKLGHHKAHCRPHANQQKKQIAEIQWEIIQCKSNVVFQLLQVEKALESKVTVFWV